MGAWTWTSFFRKLQEIVPEPRIIAEDLGEMIPEVYALRDAAGFPGMKVLQFAFFGDTSNPHLPHNYSTANCVVFLLTTIIHLSVGTKKFLNLCAIITVGISVWTVVLPPGI